MDARAVTVDRTAEGRDENLNYVVIENTPGYAPSDGLPPIFPTHEEAYAHALALAQTTASSPDDPDAEPGTVLTQTPNYIEVVFPSGAAPRAFSIIPTHEASE